MPELITFRGRPVKRRRRISHGLRLTFVSRTPGEPGEVIVVTQDEWLRYGQTQFFPKPQMPDVRALAAEFSL